METAGLIFTRKRPGSLSLTWSGRGSTQSLQKSNLTLTSPDIKKKCIHALRGGAIPLLVTRSWCSLRGSGLLILIDRRCLRGSIRSSISGPFPKSPIGHSRDKIYRWCKITFKENLRLRRSTKRMNSTNTRGRSLRWPLLKTRARCSTSPRLSTGQSLGLLDHTSSL